MLSAGKTNPALIGPLLAAAGGTTSSKSPVDQAAEAAGAQGDSYATDDNSGTSPPPSSRAVKASLFSEPPHPLPSWSDEELLDLHKTYRLAATVNYQGPLDSERTVELNYSLRSEYEVNTIKSILGERCKITDFLYIQVPPQLEALRDRLYYLRMAQLDQSAAKGTVYKNDYDTGRERTTLCFYDGEGKTVALIPGAEVLGLPPPSQEELDLDRPDTEAAALVREGAVNVLDAGIGSSTVIDAVEQRLKELGREVSTFGIGLAETPTPARLSAPPFVGIFEDYDFPFAFDLIYSQLGSSFYTPNVPRYLEKLVSILQPGGIALLDIYNYPVWQEALGIDFMPLFGIYNLSRVFDAKTNPNNRTKPKIIAQLARPTGVLIRQS